MDVKLYIPTFVLQRMKFSERLKLFILKRRAKRAIVKMDKAIKKGNQKLACTYEDVMYQTDDALSDFVNSLMIKYVP